MSKAPQQDEARWLHRQDGIVLGPLPTSQIVERLFEGALDRTALLAAADGPGGANAFRPISEIQSFAVDLAKAEARQRVLAARALEDAARRKRWLVMGSALGVATVVASVLAWRLMAHVAISGPEPLASEYGIEVEPPRVTAARPRSGGILLAYGEPEPASGEGAAPGGGTSSSTARPAKAGSGSKDRRARVARASSDPKADTSSKRSQRGAGESTRTDEDGLTMHQGFDRSGIDRVVRQKQATLYGCFKQARTRDPGFHGRFPIEFSIGNDGRVSRVWVDNPRHREGPLADCLLKTLRSWPFEPFQGEAATVGLSFNISRAG